METRCATPAVTEAENRTVFRRGVRHQELVKLKTELSVDEVTPIVSEAEDRTRSL
jgi:hypothetical protein